jgi:hypothetical protein
VGGAAVLGLVEQEEQDQAEGKDGRVGRPAASGRHPARFEGLGVWCSHCGWRERRGVLAEGAKVWRNAEMRAGLGMSGREVSCGGGGVHSSVTCTHLQVVNMVPGAKTNRTAQEEMPATGGCAARPALQPLRSQFWADTLWF